MEKTAAYLPEKDESILILHGQDQKFPFKLLFLLAPHDHSSVGQTQRINTRRKPD